MKSQAHPSVLTDQQPTSSLPYSLGSYTWPIAAEQDALADSSLLECNTVLQILAHNNLYHPSSPICAMPQ
jgi:hypothetical protein